MSTRKDRPRVAIVLLNWNQPEHTLACLRSLGQLDYPNVSVTVVDNGSTDGSPDLIRAQFPQVTLIENGRNLGFAAGNNVAIEPAVRAGADYVMLLNNDTELAPDMLSRLVAVAERDPKVGIVGPKILYYDQPDVIWSAGGTIDAYGQPGHLGADQPDDDPSDQPREADYVTGCAILVKRAVVEAIGGLDERFFIYFEETEWCARARRAGFRILYVPSARMWHKVKPDARGYSRPYLYMMARNRLLYLRCCGAPVWRVAGAILSLLRTAASWRLRPRHRDMRPLSDALLRGTAAFMLGRFGAPPARI
jgi:GT2 family glycosyltransferase